MGRYGTREDEVDRAAPRRRPRRPAARRPPVAARLGRELLDQEDGGVLRLRARDRPARRGVEHRGLRGVARAWRGRAARGRPSRAHRALQPRRRRQQPASSATGWKACATSSPQQTGLRRPAAGAARGELPEDADRGAGAGRRRSSSGSPTRRRPTDPAGADAEQHGRWLLAQLLGWHRREDKSMWWEFYRLMELTPEQLVDEADPIGGLEPVGPLDEPRRRASRSGATAFPDAGVRPRPRRRRVRPRRKAGRPGRQPVQLGRRRARRVDPAAHTVDIKRAVDDPHPQAVVPLPWVRDPRPSGATVRARRVGRRPRDRRRRAAPGRPRPAARATAARRADAGRGAARPGETDLDAARRLAASLDRDRAAIQGPPGSGKTYTGARMIVQLLARRQAGRDHGDEPQGHRQPAPAVLEAATSAAVRHPDDPARRRGTRSSTTRG